MQIQPQIKISEIKDLYKVLSEERRKELKDAFVNIHTHSYYSLQY